VSTVLVSQHSTVYLNSFSLVSALDSTESLLADIQVFNKDEWVVQYPQLREHTVQDEVTNPSLHRPNHARRSLSFADDPNFEADVVIGGPRQGLTRSITLASISDVKDEILPSDDLPKGFNDERLIPTTDFNVLRLDLKLGSQHSSTSAASLVSQLEKSSIANLLDEKFTTSVTHIDKLRLRVEDTSSKVLVTGDLNAGKSTFVNACFDVLRGSQRGRKSG
jgi:mitofusin 2